MAWKKSKLFCIAALSLLFLGSLFLVMPPSGDEEGSGIATPGAEANADVNAEVDSGPGKVLKIATPNVIKSESLIGDYYLGIFAHLSNFPLMQMSEDGRIVGRLADHYEVSEDHREWTFYIREDLYWNDGVKVTPEDVQFSILYYGEKDPAGRWINETLESSSVSQTENSVTFRFNKPYDYPQTCVGKDRQTDGILEQRPLCGLRALLHRIGRPEHRPPHFPEKPVLERQNLCL